jgi:hypothetical protein
LATLYCHAEIQALRQDVVQLPGAVDELHFWKARPDIQPVRDVRGHAGALVGDVERGSRIGEPDAVGMIDRLGVARAVLAGLGGVRGKPGRMLIEVLAALAKVGKPAPVAGST